MLQGWEKLKAEDRRKILDGVRDNTVYTGPFHVEFSPTDACNYECFFCSSGFVDRSKRLPWDRLRATLLELIAMGLRAVRLSGGGEPLIYPQIEEFLDILLERRIDVSNVTTNAYRLTPPVLDRLLRLDTSEIIVSFNDVDPERYATTNGTSRRAFDVVVENVRRLIEERDRRGLVRPRVFLQFMLWKGNHDAIERAYDLAESLRVDYLYLRDLFGIDPARRMSPAEREVAGAAVRRLVERDRPFGRLVLDFKNEKILPEHLTFGEQRRAFRHGEAPNGHGDPDRAEYCYVAWYSTVIWGSGDVFPCCMLATWEGYPPLGNILREDIGSIWAGPAYATLRDELREIALSGGRYQSRGPCVWTKEACAMKHACPVVAGLATPEFYAEALAELRAVRRRPSRWAERAAAALMQRRPWIGVAP